MFTIGQFSRITGLTVKTIRLYHEKALLPSREVYIKGPGMIFRGNPKKYLTEIQIMIAKPEEVRHEKSKA